MTLLAVLTAGYARYRLLPRMETAGADAFGRYHGQSVRLNGVAILSVLIALTATHFKLIPRARVPLQGL